ncbi:MAG: PKD domain-containing protein [Bacteroidia bacterium]|nr:PKD domain-containing protein [Bacteroidia bacterium]
MKRALLIFAFLFILSHVRAQVSINASSTQGCYPFSVNFSYSGPGANQWYWDFGDGSPTSNLQNPSHVYAQPGVHWVNMQAWMNSNYLGSAVVYINSQGVLPLLTIDPDSLCLGDVASLQLGQTGNLMVNDIDWYYGDGDNTLYGSHMSTEHTYQSQGNFNVMAIVNSNCGIDTSIGVVNIGNNTIPFSTNYFSVEEDSACPGDVVHFYITKTFTSFYIDFGDGNYSTTDDEHTYVLPGMYPVSVTLVNGCGDSRTLYDTVKIVTNATFSQVPYINIHFSPSCVGQSIDFFADRHYPTYFWDFGDQTTSTNATPSHSYSNPGTYTVTLTVANSCGSTITTSDTLNIVTSMPAIIPGNIWIMDSVCQGEGLMYIVGNGDDPQMYSWDFGDGNYSNTREGSHQYALPGTYTVTLTATNGCGQTASATFNIYVSTSGIQPNPNEYGMMVVPENNACPGDTVLLVFGPAGDSSVVTWLIDNVTPYTATQSIRVNNTTYLYAKHVFTTTGTHSAKMTYTNSCGLSFTDSTDYNITNAHQPESDFFFDNTTPKCQGKPVDFYAVGGSTYIWDFGDGSGTLVTNNTLVPVSHAYQNAGTYTVKMKVINGCGYSDETEESIIIPPSYIDITTNSVSSGCGQNNGTAIAIANGGQSPYLYEWSNGNTTFLADSLSSGIYVVNITDVNGCSNFAIATVSDLQAPTLLVNTVLDVTCFGGSNGAIDINLIGGNAPFTYQWSNGANTQDVNNLVAGPHEVIVTDVNGCVAARSIDVSQPPEVIVTVVTSDADCNMNNGVAIANVNGSTGPYNYVWSTSANTPSVNFLASGIYTVTVVDNNGCIYQAAAIINETNGPDVVLDSITGTGCLNNLSSVYIRVLNGTTPFTYLWSNGATTQDLLNVGLGMYSVVVTGSNGCQGIGMYQITKDAPATQSLCMVTVDTLTGTNQVVWEKDMNATDISGYNIYKESSQSGLYYLVGFVDYDSLSLWTDPVSDADVRSWRYKIAAVNDCNQEALWSNEHKTIHLNVNQGIGNVYNLIWDHYEGREFSSYDIFRYNANTQIWSYLTTVPSNLTSYTDVNPPAGTYAYRVDAVINACNPQVRVDQSAYVMAAINNTKSNIKNTFNNPTYGMNEGPSLGGLVLYPNPSTGDLSVYCGLNSGDGTITIFGTVGSRIMEFSWNLSVEKVKKVDLSWLSPGIYFVKVQVMNSVEVKKLIIH